MTPTEENIARIAHKLEARTDALRGLLHEAAVADVDYRVAYAKALLRANGATVGEREAQATLSCEEALMHRKTTEAVADACKESVRSLRDTLSGAQSLLRAEMESAKL